MIFGGKFGKYAGQFFRKRGELYLTRTAGIPVEPWYEAHACLAFGAIHRFLKTAVGILLEQRTPEFDKFAARPAAFQLFYALFKFGHFGRQGQQIFPRAMGFEYIDNSFRIDADHTHIALQRV